MRVTTLLFHDVVLEGRWESSGFQGADADVYKLNEADFRGHLMEVARNVRGPMVTGSELLGQAAVQDALLLTFDDGGVSAVTNIAGMIEEHGWKGHFFVTAGRIGTPGFLNPDQIRQLRRRGHVIGSHSYSHPLTMAQCSSEQLDHEWRQSVQVLSEILAEPIESASIPAGSYSRRVAASAAKAGIKLLFTSEPVTRPHKMDGCLILGRFNVQRGQSPARSAAIVAGRVWPRFQDYVFWNAKKAGKALLGSSWLRVRVWFWERRARAETTGPNRRP